MKRFINKLSKWWRKYKFENLQGKEYELIVFNRRVKHEVLWLEHAGINRNQRFGGGWKIMCGFQKGGSSLIVNLCWSSTRINFKKLSLSKFNWFKLISIKTYNNKGEYIEEIY